MLLKHNYSASISTIATALQFLRAKIQYTINYVNIQHCTIVTTYDRWTYLAPHGHKYNKKTKEISHVPLVGRHVAKTQLPEDVGLVFTGHFIPFQFNLPILAKHLDQAFVAQRVSYEGRRTSEREKTNKKKEKKEREIKSNTQKQAK